MKGRWVHTCALCGREGEAWWMREHLKGAHGARLKRDRMTVADALALSPRRREYAHVREPRRLDE
jgi:hypothetical protein